MINEIAKRFKKAHPDVDIEHFLRKISLNGKLWVQILLIMIILWICTREGNATSQWQMKCRRFKEVQLDDNLLFCRIFGKGGKYISENIRYAERVLDGQSEIMRARIYLMEHIEKEKMYQGFEKALEEAEMKKHVTMSVL